MPACFTTEQSTVEASLFVKCYLRLLEGGLRAGKYDQLNNLSYTNHLFLICFITLA